MTLTNSGNLTPSTPVQIKELVEYAPQAVVSRTIKKGKAGTLTVFAFDQGEELSEHTAPYDAYVQILDDEAELIIDGQSITAVKNDMVLMPANIPHSVHAKQQFKMLLIMIKDI